MGTNDPFDPFDEYDTPENNFRYHTQQAEHFLGRAERVNDIDAGRECIWTAQVHATLASAYATFAANKQRPRLDVSLLQRNLMLPAREAAEGGCDE